MICLDDDTTIATMMGEMPVAKLETGVRVFSRDHGIQEVTWVGTRHMTTAELAQPNGYRPVLIKAGALGPKLPEHDLMLSPGHRVLLSGEQSLHHFEVSEYLATAKQLTSIEGVDTVISAFPVTYIQISFESHEVILVNGAWIECIHPKDRTFKENASVQYGEILALFPELAAG